MDYKAILQQAQARRDKLASEVDKLDRFITATVDLLSDAKDSSLSAKPFHKEDEKTSQRRPAPVMEATVTAATRALEGLGKRTMTSDLLPLVTAEGVEVGGKDPVATLSARLSNSKVFTNLRGEGWWFTDRPLPEDKLSVGSDDKTEGRVVPPSPPSVFEPDAKGREAVPGGGP